jgi:putative endonuclease
MDRKRLGQHGEQAAARYLINEGYVILDQNWRSEHGEIDLIAQSANELVFVEVRTRASSRYGTPEDSLTQDKAKRLILTAQAYLEAHSSDQTNWRIDLIAIECEPAGIVIRLDHYPHALADYLDQIQ